MVDEKSPIPTDPLWYILSVNAGWNCACTAEVNCVLTQSLSPTGVLPIKFVISAFVIRTVVAVNT